MKISRKRFLEHCLAAGACISCPALLHSLSGMPLPGLQDLIKRIGNSNDDKERVLLLQQFLDTEISSEEKNIVEQILSIADRWANSFEKYAVPGTEGNEPDGFLCGFLNRCSLERYILPRIPEDHRLFPLIAFYRSRMLIARLIQSGNIINVPDVRDRYLDESWRLMRIVKTAFPENELARNYLGEYKPWEEIVSFNPEAPEWANYQRMVLEKLTRLIHWWVDNRQISDGQFGGGWGDDVEMWRVWVPLLFAFDDDKAIKSQEKLFNGLYRLSRMQKGYTTIMTDVEHTAEEYADPLYCMLNMQPENPVWEERSLKVMDFIENLWSGVNERGQLQFRSTWFNVEGVHPDVTRACDTPYHTRLVEPLMLLWLRKGNRRVGDFVTRWLRTWVEATFTEEAGKPAGIIPAAIHWPDGKPAGVGPNWWEPQNHTEPTLYFFPTQQNMMYECFLQAYHMTGDDYFLKPLRFVAEKRLQGAGNGSPGDYTTGSLEWSLAVLKSRIPPVLIKYRTITGDSSFDEIIEKDARGYERYIFDKDADRLTKEMDSQRKSLSLPQEWYTTEVRWTDRLFSSVRYFNFILKEPLPGFNAGFLFSCLTGNVGNYQIMPVFGVKWLTEPENIAILTEENSPERFAARLYHFGNAPRKMKVRFLNLRDGKYRWQISGGKKNRITIGRENREIEFSIPSKELSYLIVE
ncbi:MAG TPA: hypothetical protein PLV06_12855 [Bacteroidales bacterium]|nr:hypothetical protein [Bacteroidales bacterium]HPJ60490.1 hypothetical protein [Bacteroidales bacterium]HPR13270.1 hypothetical protein [Bacteroidales bacterium]HRW84939.1 hypothetical protein [Bacteroidales bacterium]